MRACLCRGELWPFTDCFFERVRGTGVVAAGEVDDADVVGSGGSVCGGEKLAPRGFEVALRRVDQRQIVVRGLHVRRQLNRGAAPRPCLAEAARLELEITEIVEGVDRGAIEGERLFVGAARLCGA